MLPPLYAHRLGAAYGPDNSAAALARTLERPVEGLETDCCLTADGQLVLLHDPLLEIGTTLSGWAHKHTAAALDQRAFRMKTSRVPVAYMLQRIVITVLAIAVVWLTVSIVIVGVCMAAARGDDALATASRTTSHWAPPRFSQAAPRPWAADWI